MMSRTVELQAVIEALGKGGGQAVGGSSGRGAAGVPQLRDSGPPDRPAAAVPPPEKGPLTVDRLRDLWPRIIEDARAKSPMLGALLQVTEIARLDGSTVSVRLLDTNPVHAEGIERQRDALALLVGRYVTAPVRIKLQAAASGERPPPQRSSRMTEEGARADRLKALRAKDPSLNAAIDALDLELLE